jgi:hypothetical protein
MKTVDAPGHWASDAPEDWQRALDSYEDVIAPQVVARLGAGRVVPERVANLFA